MLSHPTFSLITGKPLLVGTEEGDLCAQRNTSFSTIHWTVPPLSTGCSPALWSLYRQHPPSLYAGHGAHCLVWMFRYVRHQRREWKGRDKSAVTLAPRHDPLADGSRPHCQALTTTQSPDPQGWGAVWSYREQPSNRVVAARDSGLNLPTLPGAGHSLPPRPGSVPPPWLLRWEAHLGCFSAPASLHQRDGPYLGTQAPLVCLRTSCGLHCTEGPVGGACRGLFSMPLLPHSVPTADG